MKVALAADHAGVELKAILARRLVERVEVLDLGTDSTEPVDYPDIALALALAVTGGRAERGILICGSGVGASVAANKVRGIRAGLCHDAYSARQGVEHDDVNVLVLGGRVIGPELAALVAETFLDARFSGEERHVVRLAKVRDLEARRFD
jgi:RpiB/LacA/LacB family sugar-phosphate isomerase